MQEPRASSAAPTDKVGVDGPLPGALARLERALDLLERAMARSPRLDDDLFTPLVGGADHGLAALQAELQAARTRQTALQDAAAEASHVLGHAMFEVRRALDGGGEGVSSPITAEDEADTTQSLPNAPSAADPSLADPTPEDSA